MECALEVVENTGLDPDVGLRAYRKRVSHEAGCRTIRRVWKVRREPKEMEPGEAVGKRERSTSQSGQGAS